MQDVLRTEVYNYNRRSSSHDVGVRTTIDCLEKFQRHRRANWNVLRHRISLQEFKICLRKSNVVRHIACTKIVFQPVQTAYNYRTGIRCTLGPYYSTLYRYCSTTVHQHCWHSEESRKSGQTEHRSRKFVKGCTVFFPNLILLFIDRKNLKLHSLKS